LQKREDKHTLARPFLARIRRETAFFCAEKFKNDLIFEIVHVIIIKNAEMKGDTAMRNNESAEMYLETILLLKEQKAYVRAIDIVHETGYTKPSVSRALGLLRAGGYLLTDESGFLSLTESGHALAAKILERHRLLTAFLVSIGVDEETAASDACKIEHVISDASFEKMKEYAKRMGRG
jgi:Mn-dependent DtxR family transcriptional regulator